VQAHRRTGILKTVELALRTLLSGGGTRIGRGTMTRYRNRHSRNAPQQRCHASRVTSTKQLVEAATCIDTAQRRSYRLEPHRV
jgi:hypothetical protein